MGQYQTFYTTNGVYGVDLRVTDATGLTSLTTSTSLVTVVPELSTGLLTATGLLLIVPLIRKKSGMSS